MPVAVARGPILDVARRLHARVTPALAVELAMGWGETAAQKAASPFFPGFQDIDD